MYFSGRALAYQRVREVTPEPEMLFRELSLALVEAAAAQPAMHRCPVFAHLDPELGSALRGVLSAALEREVRILDPQLKRFAGGVAIGLPAGRRQASRPQACTAERQRLGRCRGV